MLTTFDELVMGGRLPSEWRVQGDADLAQVAPFPTAVDRSLRLTSAADAAAVVACRAIDPAATRIEVDLFADQPDGLAASLRDPERGLEVGISVASLGRVLMQPGGEPMAGTIFEPAQWERVTLLKDSFGAMRVAITVPGPSSPSLNESSALPGWQPGGRATEICVGSPRIPDAELFIDNLLTERQG